MSALRSWWIWAALVGVIAVPIVLAANSPLLAWRDPIYIIAGFAGIAAMGLLVAQPLLALGVLPNLLSIRGRRVHRVVGGALVLAVAIHVGALWITSPPDVVDALTFTSPTSFSVWGVAAMWAVFATAIFAVFRKRIGLRKWRVGHKALALVIALGTVIHAVQIEGTMEPVSKGILAVIVLGLTAWAVWGRR